QVAHQKKNGNDSKTEREFVREHLCTGTNPSQKRILGIRRPTANDDPVNAKRSDGEDKQNSDVHIGDHHRDSEQRATKRNNSDGDLGGTTRRLACIATACSIFSSSLGWAGGNSCICRMCTPRSPILLNVNPANCGTVSLIRRKTSSMERRESPPPIAWSKSRKISQSSRALPGGRTARFSRCSRPLPLTIEPRFSANPHPGRSTVAFSVASFGKTFIMINT